MRGPHILSEGSAGYKDSAWELNLPRAPPPPVPAPVSDPVERQCHPVDSAAACSSGRGGRLPLNYGILFVSKRATRIEALE